MTEYSIEQQYVLYAAATGGTLMDLLQHYEPWLPGREWSEMAVHVPRLAGAIIELAGRGLLEVYRDDRGVVVGADRVDLVRDLGSWRDDSQTPPVELLITAAAGMIDLPRTPPGRRSNAGEVDA